MLSRICNLCLQVAAFIDNFGIVRRSTALKRNNSGADNDDRGTANGALGTWWLTSNSAGVRCPHNLLVQTCFD